MANELVTRGYRIVARNLRVAGVEVDLIARRRRRCLLVEVKTCRAPGRPETSLSSDQRGRLHQAARRIPATLGCRRSTADVVLAAVQVRSAEAPELRFFRIPALEAGGRA